MPPKKRPTRGAAAAKKATPKKTTPKRATRARGRGRGADPAKEDGGDEDLREAMKRSLSETNREDSDLQAAIRFDL